MEESVKHLLMDPTIARILTMLVGFVIVIIAVRVVQRAFGRYIQDTNTRYRTRKFTAFLGYIAAILIVTIVYSHKLSGLNVALGLIGAGIAFASQEIIISIAGWLAIAFSGFYKTGDRIKLAGVKGDVIDIGVLRTTLMEVGDWVNGDLYNGRVVRVANSYIFKEPVFNYSGDFPFLWDEITIPIKYGSDVNAAHELLKKCADELLGEYTQNALNAWKQIVKKYMIENAIVEPLVTLVADENWMTYTVRYVVDFKKRRSTKDQLFSRILEEINKSDGKISIAATSMDINLLPKT